MRKRMTISTFLNENSLCASVVAQHPVNIFSDFDRIESAIAGINYTIAMPYLLESKGTLCNNSTDFLNIHMSVGE